MYGFQHGAFTHTEQKAIKGPTITSVKPFKRENQRSNLYKKRETRINYINNILIMIYSQQSFMKCCCVALYALICQERNGLTDGRTEPLGIKHNKPYRYADLLRCYKLKTEVF